jgi:hypothetical protein
MKRSPLKRKPFKKKPTIINKRSKKPAKKLEQKADKLWGLNVRMADKNLCQWCKYDGVQKYGNQPHHIITRTHKTLRWGIENGVTLCIGCHLFRLKREPVEYSKFIIEWLGGEEVYNSLKERSKAIFKPSIQELEDIIKDLTRKLEKESK